MWHQGNLRRVHLDFHMPEWSPEILAEFDAEQIVACCVRAKAQALYFFAKCHYGNAYYRTMVGHAHRGMGGRDFFAEIAAECVKANLPLIAYYSIEWDNRVATEHPDWAMRDPQGKQVLGSGQWAHICFHSPYGAYVAAMVKEIAAGYPIVGFHFDMVNFGFDGLSCYCERCRSLFHERTGRQIPEHPTWDETWAQFLAFRNETIVGFLEDVKKTASGVKPDLTVAFNYHGSPGFDWRVGQKPLMHSLPSFQATGESYPFVFGPLYTSMQCRFLRNLVPGRDSEMVTSRFNALWDYAIKPNALLEWECLTALANGARVMVVDQVLHTGKVDPLVYDRLGEVFSAIEARNALWAGAFRKHVLVYYSAATRDFHARGDLPEYLLSFTGAFKAILESHLQVDILCDENCGTDALSEYPVVVLANIAAMSDREVKAFRTYVAAGGLLVSTGNTGLYDERGRERGNFALADVFGAEYAGTTETRNHFFSIDDSPLGEGISLLERILCSRPAVIARPTSGEPHGTLYTTFHDREPWQTFSHHMPSPWRAVGPGFVVNAFGKGRSVYTPTRLCSSYADVYGHPSHRLALRNMAQAHSSGEPEIAVEAPLNVEAVIRDFPDRSVIHLLGFNPRKQAVTFQSNVSDRPIAPGSSMEEPLLYRAVLHVPARALRVTRWNGEHAGQEVQVRGGAAEVVLDQVHEALIVEYC